MNIKERHTLRDWFGLLWNTVQPPRFRLLQVQRQDKDVLSKLTLDTLEHIHHGIWFDRTRGRYLKAELRRRAVKALYGLCLQRIAFWKPNCLVGHQIDKQVK